MYQHKNIEHIFYTPLSYKEILYLEQSCRKQVNFHPKSNIEIHLALNVK